MKKGQPRKAVYRKDYTPYAWNVEQARLRFRIFDTHTEVASELDLKSRSGRAGPLDLDGCGLDLREIRVDGEVLPPGDYTCAGERLTLARIPAACTVSTLVHIHPADNSALEGLYQSGTFLLTQCEPEGFRKITWFPDRPDVMTRYTVTIEADRERYPVLLSNGNPTGQGQAGSGRHWQSWEDPFPKPSYLFALVAGDLAHIEDEFVTRSGRRVKLRVWVEAENIDRCRHAMDSLIKAMHWDEERFGLEYDLDIYNIVATNDFNMGAMENKSLNIFNSKYVLARPDAATDMDYQGIEGVIGHEYFHNWTGNRVTCRDWFQLTLKEGLTVFRDEEFSADMQSRAVKRIQDVRDLRARQFPEDAGPMSHPIRPDHYMEINNFYTATVYQKGAAVIRMYHTLLGEEGFQKGMRLYFRRHDGEAVTCDDFRAAMADANGADLDQFGRWYAQSGTPLVHVSAEYSAASRSYALQLRQETPPTQDQQDKLPLVIPFAVGLLGGDGRPLPVTLEGEDRARETHVLEFRETEQSFVFSGVPEAPVPSLLRDFSAPVKIDYAYSAKELATLIGFDPDPFARWEAAQRFAVDVILSQVRRRADAAGMTLDPALTEAFGHLLRDDSADPALVAEALALPDEDYLGEQMDLVDVDGIFAAREFVRRSLSASLHEALSARYAELADGAPYEKSPAAIARRSLKNVCLSYLACGPEGCELAERQLAGSDNMTDSLAAMRSLIMNDSPSAQAALDAFERQWSGDALVMDKWFAIQAMKPGHATIARVRELMDHPEFSLLNPNKVRSLIGVFSVLNPTGFHVPDGSGYRFLADQVIALNAFNPQIAARTVSAFNRWPRYDRVRRELMKAELERIAAVDDLSNDVFEIVSNALKLNEPDD